MTIRLRLSPLPIGVLCALLLQIVAGAAPPVAVAVGQGIAGSVSPQPGMASTPGTATTTVAVTPAVRATATATTDQYDVDHNLVAHTALNHWRIDTSWLSRVWLCA